MTTIWIIFGSISILLLVIYFFRGKNALWGGLTLGAIVGIVLAIIYLFLGHGFIWLIIAKAAIVGTILGFLSEIFGIVGDKIKK